MKFNRLFQLLLALILVINVSCSDDEYVMPSRGDYENGYFIANEGNFGTPTASVSFISKDLSVLENDIYKKNNNENLGDVLQTITFSDDRAFLLLNNSNKVQVVNRYNFKKTGEITAQLDNPRYMTISNGNLYVSNDKYNGGKYVNVYKLSDLSFVKKIPFASTSTAERVVEAGGTVFVQNATYSYGSTLTRINTSTNEIINTVAVPNGEIEKTISYNNNVYVIASGASNSYIYEISPAGTITKTTTLTGIANARNLEIDGGKYYFTSSNKIYTMDMNSTTAPSAPLINNFVDGGQYFTLYGFSVKDGKIFAADVKGFTAPSEVTVYNTSGTVLKKFVTGIGSNAAYVN